MYIGKLSKIYSSHQNLRTDEVVGIFKNPPTVGKSFMLFTSSLDGDKNKTRIVQTSVVQDTDLDVHGVTFRTLNSTYFLSGVVEDEDEIF